MRAFILVLLASVMFAATAIQPISSGKIEKVPESQIENIKKTLKTLKKVTDSKDRAVVSDMIYNPTTDDLYQIELEGGIVLMILVNKGQTSFYGDILIRPSTLELGKTLCAYIGMSYTDTTVPGGQGDSRVGLNSAGAWIYLPKYPSTETVIIERSLSKDNPSFRFAIGQSGILTITRTLTANLTTVRVQTTKPVPLNEWVYIQGRQNGLEHSLGWKTANDGNTVTKRFEKHSDVPVNIFRGRFFDINFAAIKFKEEGEDIPISQVDVPCNKYALNTFVKCRTLCFPNENYISITDTPFYVKEFFWNGSTPMFALMDNYDALEKHLSQIPNTFYMNLILVNALIDVYNNDRTEDSVLLARPLGSRPDNIDMFVDRGQGIIAFDLRRLPAIPQ